MLTLATAVTGVVAGFVAAALSTQRLTQSWNDVLTALAFMFVGSVCVYIFAATYLLTAHVALAP